MTTSAPTAFIVAGPESSGTRLLARVFLAAGCRGCAEHEQPFDAQLPPASLGDPIVWRRSVPHNVDLKPDLLSMRNQLQTAGYRVRLVIVSRDWRCAAHSQAKRGLASSYEHAIGRIREATSHLLVQAIAGFEDYLIVSYDNLVEHPREVLAWLTEECGLSMATIDVQNENLKHMGLA